MKCRLFCLYLAVVEDQCMIVVYLIGCMDQALYSLIRLAGLMWLYSKICPSHYAHTQCSALASCLATHLLQDCITYLAMSLWLCPITPGIRFLICSPHRALHFSFFVPGPLLSSSNEPS